MKEKKALTLKLEAQENFKVVFLHLKAEERRLSKMLSFRSTRTEGIEVGELRRVRGERLPFQPKGFPSESFVRL